MNSLFLSGFLAVLICVFFIILLIYDVVKVAKPKTLFTDKHYFQIDLLKDFQKYV